MPDAFCILPTSTNKSRLIPGCNSPRVNLYIAVRKSAARCGYRHLLVNQMVSIHSRFLGLRKETGVNHHKPRLHNMKYSDTCSRVKDSGWEHPAVTEAQCETIVRLQDTECALIRLLHGIRWLYELSAQRWRTV